MKKLPAKDTIEAWRQLHRAHRRLLESAEKTLKQQGLPPLDWYDVLLELHRAKKTGLRQYEIGEKILLSKHNLSRLIDRLEREQLVIRRACTEDARGNQIQITDNGEKMLKKIWPVYGQSIQNNFGEKLNSKEMTQLSELLQRVMEQGDYI